MFVKWFIFRYISIIIIIQRIVYLYNIFLVSSSSIIFINSTYLKSQPITEISSKYQHSSHYVKIILENSSNIIEFIFFFFSIFTLHRYLFHQRHSTQPRSRSFSQTYFHRQHRLNFSLDWPQSRYLFPHPPPDFPDAFSRRSVRLGYPWRRNGGWNSPLKPAAGERLRRFKPRLWCPGQDLLEPRNGGGLVHPVATPLRAPPINRLLRLCYAASVSVQVSTRPQRSLFLRFTVGCHLW